LATLLRRPADTILVGCYDSRGLKLGNEPSADSLGRRERCPTSSGDFLGGERREIRRDLVPAQAHENPVEHVCEARVVEPGTHHARHAQQVVAALRMSGEVADEASEPRHVPWSALATDAVAAAATQRPVEFRALVAVEGRSLVSIGSVDRRRREQGHDERDAPAQASPIRIALEQW
jgi:hypothetical protein